MSRSPSSRARKSLIAVAAVAATMLAPLASRATTHSQSVKVSIALGHDESIPVRLMKPARSPKAPQLPDLPIDHYPGLPRPPRPHALPVANTSALSTTVPSSGASCQGTGNSDGNVPPDTQVAVGTTQVVEAVNVHFQVFDKGCHAAPTSTTFATFWTGYTGTGCAGAGFSDPVVLWDTLASRWVIEIIDTTNNVLCIGISTTSDALGSYYRYSFADANSGNLPDYTKMGVMADAYYMTSDEFVGSTGYNGPSLCALDRSKMLIGATPTRQCALPGTHGLSTSFIAVMPGSLDGSTPPPSGAPEWFVTEGATLDANGNTTDLEYWSMKVDWSNSSNTVVTDGVSLPVDPYVPACGYTSPDPGAVNFCIVDPPPGSPLDALGPNMMFRLAYRNFGDHEALVVSHAVDTGLSQNPDTSTGERWYELRPNGSGGLGVYQSGTHAPDSTYRWMGSIAMDQSGDMGLGYSVSSSTIYPGLRYTGRLASDPLGQMEQERDLHVPTGYSVSSIGASSGPYRWGDYSEMSIDPTDDCTFWYSNEYAQGPPQNGDWLTWLGSFKFPSCHSSSSDFSIAESPSSLSINQGVSGTVSVTTAITQGSAQSVALSVSGLPSGVNASFNPSTITSGGSSTLTLTATTSAATGTVPVTITGTGSTTHSTTVSLTVTAANDFSISTNPTTLILLAGQSGTASVDTQITSGSAQSVALSASGVPAGVSASFNPSTINSGQSSTLTMSASSTAAAGSYTVTITGTGSVTTHSVPMNLIVASSAAGFTNYQPPLSQTWTTKDGFTYGPASNSGSNGNTAGGEPTIGADWKTGDTMYGWDLFVQHVHFNSNAPNDATWTDASPPQVTPVVGTTLDPFLFTDHNTNRTLFEYWTGSCPVLSHSDDDGNTWTRSTVPCGAGDQEDHPTIGGGPYATPAPSHSATYPDSVIFCAQATTEGSCVRSDDGGDTFPNTGQYAASGVLLFNSSNLPNGHCGASSGHVKVAPNDGTQYIPLKDCYFGDGNNSQVQGGGISIDNGANWVDFQVPGLYAPQSQTLSESDPSIGVGSDGTVYYGWQEPAYHCGGTCSSANGTVPAITVSRNKTSTWSHPVNVGAAPSWQGDASCPGNIGNVAFPTVVAGDGDRAAFAFLGTCTGGDAQSTSFTGKWYLFVSTTYDRGATWTTVDATPNDPVQIGTICLGGTGCGSGRNLLDFMDSNIDKYGNVLVGYPDGCVGTCDTSQTTNSNTAWGSIARQTSGKTLYSQYDGTQRIAITPSTATIAAGTTQAYTVHAIDVNGNDIGNLTSTSTISATPPVTCSNAACGTTHPGTYTVTATNGSMTATATLNVVPGPAASLTLSPINAVTTAGTTVAYTTTGTDAYGNSLGNTTPSTTFTINAPGSCSSNTCGSTTSGPYTVVATDGAASASTMLSVTPGALVGLVLSPANSTIKLSQSQTYTASGRDQFGNSTGDMTSSTTFTIAPDGSCVGATCSGTAYGQHTVTGINGSVVGTANLTISDVTIDHIVITPSSSTITAGGSQTYTATGYDSSNNVIGDVTSTTVFTIAPNGSCSGATCGATIAGPHTVTGTRDQKISTASLTVTAGPTTKLALNPATSSIPSGGTRRYSAQGVDQYGNPTGDLTSATTFTIAPDGSCSGVACTASVIGPHTVTGTDGTLTGTATLDVVPLAPVIVSPAEGALTPAAVTVSGTAGPGQQVSVIEGFSTLASGVMADSNGNWSVALSFADGQHQLIAKATQGSETSASSAVRTFTVDATAPTVKIFDPAGSTSLLDFYLPGDRTIRGSATDNYGVSKVVVTYTNLITGAVVKTENASCLSCPAASTNWTDPLTAGPGLYSVSAVATDVVGNNSPSVTQTFFSFGF
ncbi:MAG: hypothetical protein ACYDCC_15700 [Actinomycetota bacterium]